MICAYRSALRGILALAALTAIPGCVGTKTEILPALLERAPRSILVLPPLDESIETGATYGAYASVAPPLIELGYYVFPPALVDTVMRENGLPDPFDMHQVPLAKLREVFDPDAVMYMKVTDWGTSYQVLNSVTRISIEARLIDAETGVLLWQGTRTLAENSGSGGGGLAGMLVGAVVNQIATSISDPSRAIARTANGLMLGPGSSSLLVGPYHPQYAEFFGAAVAEQQVIQ